MHIILGATGHVGSAVAQALIDRGEQVTVVTRSANKARSHERQGAKVAVVDIQDVAALRRVYRAGKRLFMLNPPASPSVDTDTVERQSVAALLAALEGSGLEKVVAVSTYGAQPGDHIADLGVLFELERGLSAQNIPATILRAAYYMSNWDQALSKLRESHVVPSFLPADFTLPMVAPQDIGQVAARLMTEPPQGGLCYVEGPKAYSPADVAAACAATLKQPVAVDVVPQQRWTQVYTTMGFSPAAAQSFANMTSVTLERCERPAHPIRGTTSLQEYVRQALGTG